MNAENLYKGEINIIKEGFPAEQKYLPTSNKIFLDLWESVISEYM